MLFEDYIKETTANVLELLESGDYDYMLEEDCDAQDMFDVLLMDDSITGNASGSYTFCAAKAQENTADLVYDEEFLSELENAGYTLEVFTRGAETVDVIARCLALGYCFPAVESYVDEWQDSHAVDIESDLREYIEAGRDAARYERTAEAFEAIGFPKDAAEFLGEWWPETCVYAYERMKYGRYDWRTVGVFDSVDEIEELYDVPRETLEEHGLIIEDAAFKGVIALIEY